MHLNLVFILREFSIYSFSKYKGCQLYTNLVQEENLFLFQKLESCFSRFYLYKACHKHLIMLFVTSVIHTYCTLVTVLAHVVGVAVCWRSTDNIFIFSVLNGNLF